MTDIVKEAQANSDLALWQAYCEKKMALEDAELERDRYRAALEKISGLTMSMFLKAGDLAQRQKEIAAEALSGVVDGAE